MIVGVGVEVIKDVFLFAVMEILLNNVERITYISLHLYCCCVTVDSAY